MTYEERQGEGRVLCEELSLFAEDIAPRGIDRWSLLRKFVSPPSVEFVLALSLWEYSPSLETQSIRDNAYAEVVSAWRRAAAEFCAERSAF